MRNRARGMSFMLALMLTLVSSVAAAKIPHLRTQGTATQLIVDGEPFLILGGELGNSSERNKRSHRTAD